MKIVFVQPPARMGLDNYTTITQPPLGIAAMHDTVLRQTPAECCALGEGELTLIELRGSRCGATRA